MTIQEMLVRGKVSPLLIRNFTPVPGAVILQDAERRTNREEGMVLGFKVIMLGLVLWGFAALRRFHLADWQVSQFFSVITRDDMVYHGLFVIGGFSVLLAIAIALSSFIVTPIYSICTRRNRDKFFMKKIQVLQDHLGITELGYFSIEELRNEARNTLLEIIRRINENVKINGETESVYIMRERVILHYRVFANFGLVPECLSWYYKEAQKLLRISDQQEASAG